MYIRCILISIYVCLYVCNMAMKAEGLSLSVITQEFAQGATERVAQTSTGINIFKL